MNWIFYYFSHKEEVCFLVIYREKASKVEKETILLSPNRDA